MTSTQPRCGAKTKAGTPCPNWPMHGGKRCDKHGGNSPRALIKAQERLATQRAQRHLEALGEEAPHRDSIEALQAVGNQASLLLDLLSGVVSQLTEFRYEGDHGENIRGELQAYMAAMARAESVHGRIISLDLEKRRLTIDEAKIAVIVAALDKALDQRELNLSTDQKRHALAVVAKELTRNV
jgi:hypothetical protein